MEIKDFLRDFLKGEGRDGLWQEYEAFFDHWPSVEYDAALTRAVFGSVDFKHRFAKYVVGRICDGDLLYESFTDARLSSFLRYYAVVKLLNGDIGEERAVRLMEYLGSPNRFGMGNYLPGRTIYPRENDVCMPVTMQPGGGLHVGYRLFTVNMLCFKASRFVMGCRCDSGPVMGMRYHKGCSPLGVGTDSYGGKWTLFNVDTALTDDNTAVFSNGLDGDGTVEVCDWVSDRDVRVVYRADF